LPSLVNQRSSEEKKALFKPSSSGPFAKNRPQSSSKPQEPAQTKPETQPPINVQRQADAQRDPFYQSKQSEEISEDFGFIPDNYEDDAF
jgi:hypothetical protein